MLLWMLRFDLQANMNFNHNTYIESDQLVVRMGFDFWLECCQV